MFQMCRCRRVVRSVLRDGIIDVKEEVAVPLAGTPDSLNAGLRAHIGVVIVASNTILRGAPDKLLEARNPEIINRHVRALKMTTAQLQQ
jgi:hypothetical protein